MSPQSPAGSEDSLTGFRASDHSRSGRFFEYEKLVGADVASLRRGAGAVREKALDCGKHGAGGVEGSGG